MRGRGADVREPWPLLPLLGSSPRHLRMPLLPHCARPVCRRCYEHPASRHACPLPAGTGGTVSCWWQASCWRTPPFCVTWACRRCCTCCQRARWGGCRGCCGRRAPRRWLCSRLGSRQGGAALCCATCRAVPQTPAAYAVLPRLPARAPAAAPGPQACSWKHAHWRKHAMASALLCLSQPACTTAAPHTTRFNSFIDQAPVGSDGPAHPF